VGVEDPWRLPPIAAAVWAGKVVEGVPLLDRKSRRRWSAPGRGIAYGSGLVPVGGRPPALPGGERMVQAALGELVCAHALMRRAV